MRTVVAVAGSVLGLLAALPDAGAAPDPARYLASNCTNCHGTDGRSAGGIPSLAGLSPDYFIEQMRLFRTGRREATIMHQLAPGYTDEQIAALAAFFAGQASEQPAGRPAPGEGATQ